MGQYYQKVLTKNFSPIINSLGIDYLTRPLYAGKGQILILHRVIPASGKQRIHNHLSLEISPEHLENIFEYFKKRNYDFINLDMLPGWLEENRKTKRKFVIFTFDDGYKDNYTYAYPIFRKHNIPFTIYITCSFPNKKAIIWWYILEDLILKNDKIDHTFSTGSVKARCQNQRTKESTYIHIRGLIKQLPDENLEEELIGFFGKYNFDIFERDDEMVLSWDDIAELAKDPIVTIGAHTLNHYNLRYLSEEHAINEMMGSKEMLESKISRDVKHFSYPFGEYSTREIDLARRCNFLTTTTTENANVFYEHVDHMFTLPRISVNVLTNKRVLNLMVNGFFPAILHRFRRLVY